VFACLVDVLWKSFNILRQQAAQPDFSSNSRRSAQDMKMSNIRRFNGLGCFSEIFTSPKTASVLLFVLEIEKQ
jgi:hypothetical protein